MGRLFRPRTKNIKASGVLADAKKSIMAVGTRNREISPPYDVRKHFILISVNIINVFWRYRAAANGSGNGAAAPYDSGSEAAAATVWATATVSATYDSGNAWHRQL